MARICPLFSGSTGNSTYIGTNKGAILVDAGASFKGLMGAVQNCGGNIDEIKAVFITHEHNDHIQGLKTLLQKTDAILVASNKTLETLINAGKVPAKTETLAVDGNFSIFDFGVQRFATSHDCDGSSGYSFILPDMKKVSVCTDLGVVTDEVRNAVTGSDVLLFESNHDIEMLKKGPYPPFLKVRILGERGHLSNNACAAELPKFFESGTKRFILGHLSQNNNTPILARSANEAALIDIGAENGKDYLLKVALPYGNGVTVI